MFRRWVSLPSRSRLHHALAGVLGRASAGIEAPTLKEAGFDVVVQNWRMVAAAPGLTDEQVAKISADIEKLNGSAGWTSVLETKGWANTYLGRRCLCRAAEGRYRSDRNRPA